MEVIEFIKKNGLEKLTEEYGIKVRRHNIYNNLVLLKYSQIDSPRGVSLVDECRGVILNEDQDWKIICRSFDRFYNYEEFYAPKIDIQKSSIQEKLDGSLAQVYYYNGIWQMATSGSPDASGTVAPGETITFKRLFWQTWEELGYNRPKRKDLSYSFELCTNLNQVCVQHKTNRIVLIGARDLATQLEVDPLDIDDNWERAKRYDFNSLEEICEFSKGLDPTQNEGFVVVGRHFNRVKIKSSQYVALSHLRDSIYKSPEKGLIEIIRNCESAEFLVYFESFRKLHDELKIKFEALILKLMEIYEEIKGIESQKEFALEAIKSPLSSCLFTMRKTGCSTREFLKNMSIDHLMDVL